MALLISTNMYKAEEFKRVLPYVEKWRGQVGVEVFPMFHQQIFAPLLEESTDILSRVPISFHGPYYKAEHSAPQGTPEYEYTMELVEQTLHYSEKLNSRYMVFHHNNCAVRDKERMLRDSCVNYRRVEELFRPLGIPAAVENAGVMDRNCAALWSASRGRFWHTIFTTMTEFTTATGGLGTEPWILKAL